MQTVSNGFFLSTELTTSCDIIHQVLTVSEIPAYITVDQGVLG